MLKRGGKKGSIRSRHIWVDVGLKIHSKVSEFWQALLERGRAHTKKGMGAGKGKIWAAAGSMRCALLRNRGPLGQLRGRLRLIGHKEGETYRGQEVGQKQDGGTKPEEPNAHKKRARPAGKRWMGKDSFFHYSATGRGQRGGGGKACARN